MNLELMQSIGSIIVDLRKVKGCLGIDFQQDSQDKDRFSLRLDWQNPLSLRDLLDSKEYNVFEGAIRVLSVRPNIGIIDGDKTIKIDPETTRNVSISRQIISELKHIL